MSLPADLIGNWWLPSEFVSKEGEILHISDRGRIVHFTFVEKHPDRRLPMALWIEKESGNQFRVRPRPADKGWLVELRIEDDKLIIKNTNTRFVAKSAAQGELPGWFPQALDRAMVRMDKRETDSGSDSEEEAERFPRLS